MEKTQLRELIKETLIEIDMYSEDAVNLIMGTCAQESALGYCLKQIKGPALGIMQMEPVTFRDICYNYLSHQYDLSEKIKKICSVSCFDSLHLIWNLKLSICFARLHYRRVKEKLPCDIQGYAAYWKKYYNTPLGKGTEQEFIDNYKKYVL